jgi:hypothetical protein
MAKREKRFGLYFWPTGGASPSAKAPMSNYFGADLKNRNTLYLW